MPGEGLEADLVAGVIDAEARVVKLLEEEDGAALEVHVLARNRVLKVHECRQLLERFTVATDLKLWGYTMHTVVSIVNGVADALVQNIAGKHLQISSRVL